jgi:hypothetical protein
MDSQEADKTKWEASLERWKPMNETMPLRREDKRRHTTAVIIPNTPYSVFLSC